MTPHAYLDQGLAILEARLKSSPPGPFGADAEVRPFLTISRETGAGGSTLGRMLIPMLDDALGAPGQGWVFLDKDLLAKALSHHRLPERLAEFLPEDAVSEIKATIGELVGLHPPIWNLERQVAEAILQLAHMGRVILAGRAAHLVTEYQPGGLHVRLVASLEARLRRIMELQGCDVTSAEAHILKTDLARRRYVKTHFGQDIDDPHTYDLVVNTDRVPPATAARLIVDALQDRLADTHHPSPRGRTAQRQPKHRAFAG